MAIGQPDRRHGIYSRDGILGTHLLRAFAHLRIIMCMRVRDYFAGRRFLLRSPFSVRSATERINEAAGSVFWPFTTGVVGGVWLGHVRLRYRSSPFEYNAKPVLSGRLRDGSIGSSLDLNYRAPVFAYVFFPLWYGILALVAVGIFDNGWDPGITSSDKAAVLAILTVLFLAPLGLHAIGTRRSDEELAELLDFLAQQVDAKH